MDQHRICRLCSAELPISGFYMRGNGYRTECKDCIKNKRIQHYKDNREKVLQVNYNYRIENKLKIAQLDKEYAQANKEKIKKYKQNYAKCNKELINNKLKIKYRTNVQHKLAVTHRNRLNKCIKFKRDFKSSDLLGITISQFKLYLESKFLEGMTWDNHGEWHIDHIIPLVKFDLTKEEDCRKAFHYTNTQPLWAIDNLRKNKYG